jgi:hypothetical protein
MNRSLRLFYFVLQRGVLLEVSLWCNKCLERSKFIEAYVNYFGSLESCQAKDFSCV